MVSLKANQTSVEKFYLHTASYLSLDNKVIVEGALIGDIEIITSRSSLCVDSDGEIYANVCVENQSAKDKCARLETLIRPDSDHRVISVTPGNINQLLNYTLLSPCYKYNTGNTERKNISIESLPNTMLNNLTPYKLHKLNVENTQNPENIFTDPSQYIDKGPKDPDVDNENFLIPKVAYTVHDNTPKLPAHEIVDITQFPFLHRPYVKDIFIDCYPTILAQSSLSVGNLSKTLGYYTITLKENATLPSHTKMFFLNNTDRQHLIDILQFMEKNNIIQKCPVDPLTINAQTLVGAPSYLIPRASPNSPARLIVDFSKINNFLAIEQPIIPPVSSIINQLKNFACFSSLDLSNAFPSVGLSPPCRHLTKFNTAVGSYFFKSLPAGLNICPSVLCKMVAKILHEEIVRDDKGRIIYEAENVAKMRDSPLHGVFHYFDDVLVASPMQKTYEETIDKHYKLVKIVVDRLVQHQAIIGFHKSILGKHGIKFLGYKITNNFIIMDQSRIDKMKNASVPQTTKGWRSFIGLVNSLRPYLQPSYMADLYKITPLTSSVKKLKANQEHIQSFNNLKTALTTEPIFCSLINQSSKFLLFTDASSQNSSYFSATLCQVSGRENEADFPVPSFLNLDDPTDQMIYSKKLPFRPISLTLYTLTHSEINKVIAKTQPPMDYLDDKYFGYTENTYKDSLFLSIKNILAAYRCKEWDVLELRKACIKIIKSSELSLNISTFVFNNNRLDYKNFIEQLSQKGGMVDRKFYVFEAMIRALTRPGILISNLPEHSDQKIIYYNQQYSKPPIVLSVHLTCDNILIFRPYMVDKQVSYNLQDDKRHIQVVAYHTRVMPPSKKTAHILENEATALLSSLEALKCYYGNNPLELYTDSRTLYLLYSRTVAASSTKICRYSFKLLVDYKNVTLRFVKSDANIADFLSKHFLISNPMDTERIDIKRFHIAPMNDVPDRIFTLQEWQEYVDNHPEYLSILDNSTFTPPVLPQLQLNMSTVKYLDQAKSLHLDPIFELDKRLSYEKMIMHQDTEFEKQKQACLFSENNKIENSHGEVIFLKFGLLYKMTGENEQISLYVPSKLVAPLLAFAHLSSGHGGYTRMVLALANYSFCKKDTLIRQLVARCYACQLVNISSRKVALKSYPIPSKPFETISIDLAENLNKNSLFQHLLIACCSLTDALWICPLKTKSAKEACFQLLYGLCQHYDVKYLLADNGPCWNDKNFTSMFATLNITRIHTSAQNPSAKGFCERRVRLVKTVLKKFLVSNPDAYNWHGLEFIVTKILNSTISPRTNCTPNKLIFGSESKLFNQGLGKLHPLIQEREEILIEKYDKLKHLVEVTRKKIDSDTQTRNKRLNKTRIKKSKCKVNDIVFVKDMTILAGAPRPLKTYFSNSIYVVKEIKPTTAIVRRLSDNFEQLYSLNDIKKYEPLNPIFDELPDNIRNILAGDITKITPVQLNKIRQQDPYDFPGGIDLEKNPDYISFSEAKGDDDYYILDKDTTAAPVDQKEDAMTQKQAEKAIHKAPPTPHRYSLRNRKIIKSGAPVLPTIDSEPEL